MSVWWENENKENQAKLNTGTNRYSKTKQNIHVADKKCLRNQFRWAESTNMQINVRPKH